MMDRLREDGFVEPRSARPAQGTSVADAADAIEARLAAGDALRAEAERQLVSAEDQPVGRDLRRTTSTYGLTQTPSQSPEGGRLQKTQSDADQFRRRPDNSNYDQKIVVSVAPKDDRVFNFEFDRATTLLGITFKNVSEVPEDYPDSLPQTWLYADLMVAVSRRVGPSLPNDFGEYEIHTSDQLEVGESVTYGRVMKTGGGSAVVLIHNRTEMAIEMTIGAAFGDPL